MYGLLTRPYNVEVKFITLKAYIGFAPLVYSWLFNVQFSSFEIIMHPDMTVEASGSNIIENWSDGKLVYK